MGAAKNLMGFFIKVEDDGKEKPKKEEAVASPQFAVLDAAAPRPVMAQEDAEIKRQLADAIEQNNQPGYDYFEMAKSIEAQAAFMPSESLRFQSTFATIAPLGVTPEKLVDSANFYLSVLKKKEDDFNKTVNAHMAEAVTSRENEATKFDADMVTKSEQIKKLTEEINSLQQQKTAVVNEISKSKAQIEQVKNNFATTMKVFVDRINSDIEKIKTYLKPVA